MKKKFKGIMPALITPFDGEGRLLEDSVRCLMDWELERGARGFYINGATGEGPLLCEETRMRMAETAVKHMGGRGCIINHVGSINIQESLRLAYHAKQIGCDAISSLPPVYFNQYSGDELMEYYRRLSESCDLPLLVYANQMFGQGDITEFISRVMELPNVIGVKFTRQNYYEMHCLAELNGGDINIINGPDETLICGLMMGADGGIGSTYNLMTDWFAELYSSFQDGDMDHARDMQYRINRVIRVLLRYGVTGSIKETFRMMGIEAGVAAFPGKRFSGEAAGELKRELDAAGYRFGER